MKKTWTPPVLQWIADRKAAGLCIPLSYSALAYHECPWCGAPPGRYCKTPQGRFHRGTGGVHEHRMIVTTDAERKASEIKL